MNIFFPSRQYTWKKQKHNKNSNNFNRIKVHKKIKKKNFFMIFLPIHPLLVSWEKDKNGGGKGTTGQMRKRKDDEQIVIKKRDTHKKMRIYEADNKFNESSQQLLERRRSNDE